MLNILNITSAANSGVNAQRMTDRMGMVDVQQLTLMEGNMLERLAILIVLSLVQQQ